MSEPFVDVIIPCHDERRPIERAVSSALQDPDTRGAVRVTVIAHGLPAAPFEARLAGVEGDWRVEPFADGIRSPAGPYNHGLDLATADYVFRLDSDDYLEPGAMRAWLAHVRAERPSAAIVPMRIEGDPVMANPLTRLGRVRNMDAARDRLYYRTAPLAFVAREELLRLGLRMTPKVRTGEDFDFSIRLWSFGTRVDVLWRTPCYVIGTDAPERTTGGKLSIEETLDPIVRLLRAGLPATLRRSHRRALAIKLVRTSIIAAARARPSAEDWRGDDEVATLAEVLRRVLGVAPGILTPFNRLDRRLLDSLLSSPRVATITLEARRASAAGRMQRWFTRNPLHSFDRESTLRRYVLYFLKRERSTPPS